MRVGAAVYKPSMMKRNKIFSFFAGALSFVLFTTSGCKKWDSHVATIDPKSNETLVQEIAKQSNLSVFLDYVKRTGLDALLSSSKTYTVWAPDNTAMAAIPATVVSNNDELKKYLSNFIAEQLFFTRDAVDSIRVPMLNGKRVYFYNTKLDDATLTTKDVAVKNGVLHIINAVVAPLPTVWEYLESTKATYLQNNFITALSFLRQDPALAEVQGIDPLTGETIYVPGTGMVVANRFKEKVADLTNEDSLFTYFILANPAYNSEKARVAPYFKSDEAAITDTNAAWTVVKDLIVRGNVNPASLPAEVIATSGARLPLSQAAVVATHKMSNGMVYILNACAPALAEKIKPAVVEGEYPYSFSSTNGRRHYRERYNPLTGLNFRDLFVQTTASANYISYLSNQVYTMKYKVYWVALNDYTAKTDNDNNSYGSLTPFSQKLVMDTIVSTTFAYKSVLTNDYTEVYIGDYVNDKYDYKIPYLSGSRNQVTLATTKMFLVANTAAPFHLSLDYLKFVPVFE